MSTYSHETQQIADHAQRVTAEADTISTRSADLAGTGAGDHLMYGVLCGAVAHPVLSAMAGSGGEVVQGLTEVLRSAADSLTTAAELYQRQEDEHVDLSDQIVSHLDSIQLPPR